MGGVLRPLEYDPPLVVDPDAVKSPTVSLQGFKSVSGRNEQVLQPMRGVDHIQFSPCDPKNIRRKPANMLRLSAVKQVFRRRVSERYNRLYWK
jgi:hypothetical protein